jgi:CRP-like cAMP-binding protein
VTLKRIQKDNLKSYVATGVKILEHCSTFAGLGKDQLSEIATVAAPHYFKKGEFIFHQGDPPEFFYIVQKGMVKTFKVSTFGKQIIVKIASFGDTLNASALFGEKHFVSAQAIDEVMVLSIRKKEYLSLVNKYPLIAMNIVTILGKGLDSEYERILDLIGETVEQRLCNFLFSLSVKFGTTLSLTREELGDLAGTTTETTIRVLSRLKAADIISSSRGKIIILNQTKLQTLTQHHQK